MKKEVVIVGAGPSGLATAACLNLHSIPNVILEREDCCASLWKKKAYDRLHLHLAKQFCHLPHKPHHPNAPTFIPREQFIQYLEDYVSYFKLNPLCNRSVDSASHDKTIEKWRITARNTVTGAVEEYTARFLVVATGENSEAYIPNIQGLESFDGEIVHSNQYKSGKQYDGKAVLVVGCGNSGMEIAYDLSNYGAKTSIVIRSPFHVLSRGMVYIGMVLLKYLPCNIVDSLVLILSKLEFGDMSEHGIQRPEKGPFFLKASSGRSPVIDVGTLEKIKSGEIQVVPALKSLRGNEAAFADGKQHQFDAIVFATGYRSMAKNWLQDEDDHLLTNDGMPKQSFPNHWKGTNGLYCAGLSRRGLAGISMDAQNIADDIKLFYYAK